MNKAAFGVTNKERWSRAAIIVCAVTYGETGKGKNRGKCG